MHMRPLPVRALPQARTILYLLLTDCGVYIAYKHQASKNAGLAEWNGCVWRQWR